MARKKDTPQKAALRKMMRNWDIPGMIIGTWRMYLSSGSQGRQIQRVPDARTGFTCRVLKMQLTQTVSIALSAFILFLFF